MHSHGNIRKAPPDARLILSAVVMTCARSGDTSSQDVSSAAFSWESSEPGRWVEVLNGDAEAYGGSGVGNLGAVEAEDVPWHGYDHSITVNVPPLATVVFAPEREESGT